MGGFDDHVAIMGDWMPPSPSPRAFFSSILGDDLGTRSAAEPTRENKTGTLVSEPEGYASSRNSDGKGGDQAGGMSSLSEQKIGSRGGGLLERMAARAGFNAPRLNTESIRTADLSQNQEVRSPYLTIPPGLSPTTLLDSPVFLSNSLAQPSPTTGKFPFPSSGDFQNSTMFMEASRKSKESSFDNNDSSSFAFQPVIQTGPSIFPGTFGKVPPSNLARQSFPNVEPTQVYAQNGTIQRPDFSRCSTEKDNGSGNITSEHSPPPDELPDEETDQRGSGDPNFLGAPADDGYNWRKYGQKQVKGSEYPRSYYKCTHLNCPVKKKVERSQEGHITEIIYKGAHNHPKPTPNRRSALGSANPLGDMQIENTEQAGTGGDGDPIWANMQKGSGAGDPDWRNDNLEVTTSAPLGSEYCNGSSLQAQNATQFESGDAVDRSCTFSNDEDEDDRGTHGSVSLGYDGEGDESESKRRKIETYAADMSGATRAIREPRVVVQTTSEVDILDDGYRWRKYGQKVVKGNPNPSICSSILSQPDESQRVNIASTEAQSHDPPYRRVTTWHLSTRSYYKCTSAGCTVRKHVERASHDLKSVITTYEGKHNHDVPAARNSSHVNSGVSNSGPSQATAATQSHLHRPEPSQLQNTMARFEGPLSLGSFGLAGRPPQLGGTPGFGFGMNPQGLTNLAMAGLGANPGKLPVLPVHPYLGQQRPVNHMSFMMSKGEPKMEPVSDPGLNISNSSSVYQQVMSRLPLGPHM